MGRWSHLNTIFLHTGCCPKGRGVTSSAALPMSSNSICAQETGQEGSCCTGHTHIIGLAAGISWGSCPGEALSAIHGMQCRANMLHSHLNSPEGVHLWQGWPQHCCVWKYTGISRGMSSMLESGSAPQLCCRLQWEQEWSHAGRESHNSALIHLGIASLCCSWKVTGNLGEMAACVSENCFRKSGK